MALGRSHSLHQDKLSKGKHSELYPSVPADILSLVFLNTLSLNSNYLQKLLWTESLWRCRVLQTQAHSLAALDFAAPML